jgi:hypothetical protein
MTEVGLATTWARIDNRQAIPERNVVCANVRVAPLDIIADIIQTYHWLPMQVREFCGNLEVVQDEDNGIILQSIVHGHAF